MGLRLPDYDKIHLLINGISNLSIRAAALALELNSLDSFLERMHHLTTSCEEPLRKFSANPRFSGNLKDNGSKTNKLKDPVASAENPVQLLKDLHCVYCHGKDHIRTDYPKLKKKDQSFKSSLLQPVAAVSMNEENSSQESVHTESSQIVALVNDSQIRKIISDDSVLKITEFNNIPCNLSALVDTGSPISFICPSIFKEFCNSLIDSLSNPSLSYKALNDGPIEINGIIRSSIKFELLPNISIQGNFHVLRHNSLFTHIIIGRDFLRNKLFFAVNFADDESEDRVHLFSQVASAEIIEHKSIFDSSSSDVVIDFDSFIKNKLLSLFHEIENTQVPVIQDDYLVKINLKDDSIYAYAPRKFAWTERIQMREITDDLLNRGIIKPSSFILRTRGSG